MEANTDSKYLPISDEVVKLVYDRNKPKVVNQSITIDPSWYVTESKKSLEETFICAICHTVVVEPTECEKCEKVYCAKCIQHWITTKKQERALVGNSSIEKQFKVDCPTCKQQFIGKPLHRYARSHLEEFKFKCGHCNSQQV